MLYSQKHYCDVIKKFSNSAFSGLSAPSPTNPFHCDQPRLTLNQMRPSSTSPLPPHMLSYSPSLPLPLPHQPPILPSSLTQPPAGLLDLPSNLPQPLLPLSPRPAPRTQSQTQTHSHNPFLWDACIFQAPACRWRQQNGLFFFLD